MERAIEMEREWKELRRGPATVKTLLPTVESPTGDTYHWS